MKDKICALIPAYNEAETIASVIRETRQHVSHVIVIDDGSDDGTGEIARDCGATWLRLERNSGKGCALREGIRHIRGRDLEYVLFLDGDGQHRPSDIPALLETALSRKSDMVIGARSFDRSRMPSSRFLSNTVGSKMASFLLGVEVMDSQSGFRLIRKRNLDSLRLRSRKYEIEMEILIKMVLAKSSIAHASVSMVYENCKARSKMRPVHDTIRICIWSMVYRFFKR